MGFWGFGFLGTYLKRVCGGAEMETAKGALHLARLLARAVTKNRPLVPRAWTEDLVSAKLILIDSRDPHVVVATYF